MLSYFFLFNNFINSPILGLFLLSMFIPYANHAGAAVAFVLNLLINFWFGSGLIFNNAKPQEFVRNTVLCSKSSSQFLYNISRLQSLNTKFLLDNQDSEQNLYFYSNEDFLATPIWYCLFSVVFTVVFGTLFSLIYSFVTTGGVDADEKHKEQRRKLLFYYRSKRKSIDEMLFDASNLINLKVSFKIIEHIYINDIPKRNKTNNEYSLLFADDLGNLENKINKYTNELELWLIKCLMKISVEKSCSVVFSRYKKESDNLSLKIYGNRIVSQKEIKFLDIVKQKMGSQSKTLGNLYKFLVGSILDYSFPCLNSFSENNIKKLQAIQNTAVRSILMLKYDNPSNIVHHEAFNKLKLLTVSNRLFELSERYVGTGMSHSIPLIERLVKE
ncbi:Sodium-coupled monocarboxylate transporter 1 [Brachionus plicatilis]|uniref:Sodium-coupled monocarboxylate transporter 1 n=1 Tax=Brachionus plicatilis TaxID=10195 RepID=A0A3M7RPE4_BRAPC|nr:Sodium-coupled monocarboxylate transporter 1 [Brachionus plicatilis]